MRKLSLVARLLIATFEPLQLVLNEEWHDMGELHRLLLGGGEPVTRLP
jgi:hypothetical protein